MDQFIQEYEDVVGKISGFDLRQTGFLQNIAVFGGN